MNERYGVRVARRKATNRTDSQGRCAPRCSTCRRRCWWAEDAWYCPGCGNEWHSDHGPEYAAPGNHSEDAAADHRAIVIELHNTREEEIPDDE